MSETLQIGGHNVFIDGELTVTTLSDGMRINAIPQSNQSYRDRAKELGYGDDTAAMSRDHELCHALFALWMGLPESPTFRGVVERPYCPYWDKEEAAVLAIQSFARKAGVDILQLARDYSE